jgi:hypothetical protein
MQGRRKEGVALLKEIANSYDIAITIHPLPPPPPPPPPPLPLVTTDLKPSDDDVHYQISNHNAGIPNNNARNHIEDRSVRKDGSSYDINDRLKMSFTEERKQVMGLLKWVIPVGGVAEIIYEYGANYEIINSHSLRGYWDSEEKRWRRAYIVPQLGNHEGFLKSVPQWVLRVDYMWGNILLDGRGKPIPGRRYWFNAGKPISVDLKQLYGADKYDADLWPMLSTDIKELETWFGRCSSVFDDNSNRGFFSKIGMNMALPCWFYDQPHGTHRKIQNLWDLVEVASDVQSCAFVHFGECHNLCSAVFMDTPLQLIPFQSNHFLQHILDPIPCLFHHQLSSVHRNVPATICCPATICPPTICPATICPPTICPATICHTSSWMPQVWLPLVVVSQAEHFIFLCESCNVTFQRLYDWAYILTSTFSPKGWHKPFPIPNFHQLADDDD